MERWLKRQRWQTILTAENGSRSLAMFAQYLGCGRRHGWGCGDPLLLLLLLHCCNCAIEVAGCCWLVASRLVSVVWAVKEVCPSVVCRRFLLFPFCRLQSAVSSLDTSQSRTQLKTQTKYNKKKIIIKTRKKRRHKTRRTPKLRCIPTERHRASATWKASACEKPRRNELGNQNQNRNPAPPTKSKSMLRPGLWPCTHIAIGESGPRLRHRNRHSHQRQRRCCLFVVWKVMGQSCRCHWLLQCSAEGYIHYNVNAVSIKTVVKRVVGDRQLTL